MLFMNGLYFALRSGDEHRQLRFDPCQIQLMNEQDSDHICNTLRTSPRTDLVD